MHKRNLLEALALCFVAAGSAAGLPINIALGGSASQSSTNYGAVASRAIDGNTNRDYFGGSVSHTVSDYQAWWQVDLLANYRIGEIVIWNRDSYMERLSNFNVSILDGSYSQVWRWDYYTSGGYPDCCLDITLQPSYVGRYVKIQLNGQNYLALAEVQIYADTGIPEPSAWTLIAAGLTALAFYKRRGTFGRSQGRGNGSLPAR